MNLLGRLLSQSGKPRGLFGRLLLCGMNYGHSGLTSWGLSKVRIPEDATILDIGCGGGRTLAYLSALVPTGKAVGVDYSQDAVAVMRRRNRRLISSGRASVVCGSVSAMPFPDRVFDCVSAVETYYFWPDVERDLAEVRRVMKPNGLLALIAGTYRGSRYDKLNERLIRSGLPRCFSVDDFETTLQPAGFEAVVVTTESRRGWICVVSRAQAESV